MPPFSQLQITFHPPLPDFPAAAHWVSSASQIPSPKQLSLPCEKRGNMSVTGDFFHQKLGKNMLLFNSKDIFEFFS